VQGAGPVGCKKGGREVIRNGVSSCNGKTESQIRQPLRRVVWHMGGEKKAKTGKGSI